MILQQLLKESKNCTRLYRGLTQKFNKNHDITTTDAQHGYSTWTDNKELAKQYAGDNGFVYYVDVPNIEIKKTAIDENPSSSTYGDRNLCFIKKVVGINGIDGKEYQIYTFHDMYDTLKICEINEESE